MARKKDYKDTDINILRGCTEALMKSTSRRMLLANINYIVDFFVFHPSKETIKFFDEKEMKKE